MIKRPGLPIVRSPQGLRINLPGVRYPEQTPGETAAHPLPEIPAGFASTSELALQAGLPALKCRIRLNRNMHGVWVKGARRHFRAWHRAAALDCLRDYAAASTLPPSEPPPGYCGATAAARIIGRSRSSLVRYTRQGRLHPLRGRAPGTASPRLFFSADECRQLVSSRRPDPTLTTP